MMLAAGLEGIREELDPGEPHGENMYRYYVRAELDAWDIRVPAPHALARRSTAFDADPLASKVLGPLMHEEFVSFKRAEWDEYHTHVSDWERTRYLRQF